MLKRSFFWIASALLLQLTFLQISGCSDSSNMEASKPAKEATVISQQNNPWLQVLRSHTTGQLSRFGSIDLHFNQDLPKSQELAQNSQLAQQLLSFEPAIEGTATLVNKRHYRFTPTQPLPSGQAYSATLSAQAVALTQEGSEDFVFNFNVIEQAFEIKMNGLEVNQD